MPNPSKPNVISQILRGCGYSVTLLGLGILVLWVFFAPPAREKARRQSCASNLKQLSLAASAYAQDYDGHFPLKPRPGGDWMAWRWSTWTTTNHLTAPTGGPLMDYAKNCCICWCPSDRASDRPDFKADPRSSYLWNDALCGKLIDDYTGQPLIWDREPWHRHQRNVSYLTRDGNSIVRLVP